MKLNVHQTMQLTSSCAVSNYLNSTEHHILELIQTFDDVLFLFKNRTCVQFQVALVGFFTNNVDRNFGVNIGVQVQ